MRSFVLLFEKTSYDILGECVFYDEKCLAIRLNSHGDARVGLSLSCFSPCEGPVACISRFREWAYDEDIFLIAFPMEYVSVWNEIASLSLSSLDRYVFTLACSSASRQQREKWIEKIRCIE